MAGDVDEHAGAIGAGHEAHAWAAREGHAVRDATGLQVERPELVVPDLLPDTIRLTAARGKGESHRLTRA